MAKLLSILLAPPQLSDMDINVLSCSNDATPEFVNGKRNSHGTKCAGVIAMEKNNDKCGVGVAYKSSITGEILCIYLLAIDNLKY